MSLYTSLSGLNAAQTDLSVTSNNIANVSSLGFKKSSAQFGDIIASSALQSSNIAGQGTHLVSMTQDFSQGSFQTTDSALDLAVSGQGFFATRSDLTGGQVAFTRNGSFTIGPNNYITDANGAYVQALPVDTLGNVTATGLDAMQNLLVPQTSGQPRQTSNISLTLSLPSSADLPASRDAYASGTYAFDRNDPNSYNQASSTTIYDASGQAIPATIYYVRTSAPDAGSSDSTWNAYVYAGDQQAGAPIPLTFDSTGALTSPTGSTALGSVQPTGASAPLNLTINIGAATKQGDSAFTVNSVSQDGNTTGKFSSISVGTDGLVTASYSDGSTKALGKIALATFPNPAGLRQLGDSKWTVTGNSGDPIVTSAGTDGMGTLQSGTLEQSNVDISTELVSLIMAQRNFQANAKAIQTDNQITQTILQNS